jgi:hypothetical protein
LSSSAINQETLEFENINYLEYKEFRKISILHFDVLKGNNYDNNTIILI